MRNASIRPQTGPSPRPASTMAATRLGPALALVLLAATARADEGRTFPFRLGATDTAKTAIDVSRLNRAPIDEADRVGVKAGRFVTTDGRRVRFLGVNFSFSANVPDHDGAETVAAHLAKFGVNAVRHHHMDARDIWRKNPDGTRQLDPAKLERLAYLVTQLGAHGVYSNINLHVSRTLTEQEGFEHAKQLGRYNKYTLYVVPRMREMLKDYARGLLTYKNPHTGRRLVDEPSVAMVEITNENRFSPLGFKPLEDIPLAYLGWIKGRWNRWLKKKYGTTEALLEAWGQTSEPLGEPIADSTDFSSTHKPWSLMDHGKSRVSLALRRTGPEGHNAVHLQIDRAGPSGHHLEFAHRGLSLEQDRIYTLSFRIRAAEPREAWVDVSRDGPPWGPVGFGRRIDVGKTWTKHTYAFRATETLRDKARWIFKLGGDSTDVWLADLSIRAGGDLGGVGPDQSLEKGTIALPFVPPSNEALRDIRAFMVMIETEFFQEIERFLKDELNVRVPIAGTQVGYVDLRALGVLDYVDAHAYWQHPRWTGRPWSRTGWRIGNTPTVRSRNLGVLPGLAQGRLKGLPFTVSEYNQPAPNDYQAEAVPGFAVIGSLQDWDGLFVYSFQHHSSNWLGQKIQGFFDVNGNALVMGLMPTAALMYRRGDIEACQRLITLELGESVPAWRAWQHRIAVDYRTPKPEDPDRRHAQAPDAVRSDTGQFVWHRADDETARFLLDTPRTKLAVGFIASDRIQLGPLTLRTGPASRGFGVIALTSLDDKPIAESSHLLATTIAHARNTGMVWNDTRTSVDDNWGTDPVRVEIIPATLQVRCRARTAFALDATGARSHKASVAREGNALRLALDAKDKAIWYELCPAE